MFPCFFTHNNYYIAMHRAYYPKWKVFCFTNQYLMAFLKSDPKLQNLKTGMFFGAMSTVRLSEQIEAVNWEKKYECMFCVNDWIINIFFIYFIISLYIHVEQFPMAHFCQRRTKSLVKRLGVDFVFTLSHDDDNHHLTQKNDNKVA